MRLEDIDGIIAVAIHDALVRQMMLHINRQLRAFLSHTPHIENDIQDILTSEGELLDRRLEWTELDAFWIREYFSRVEELLYAVDVPHRQGDGSRPTEGILREEGSRTGTTSPSTSSTSLSERTRTTFSKEDTAYVTSTATDDEDDEGSEVKSTFVVNTTRALVQSMQKDIDIIRHRSGWTMIMVTLLVLFFGVIIVDILRSFSISMEIEERRSGGAAAATCAAQ